MATRSDPGLLEAILIDLRELHSIWMALLFPRQRAGKHSVLGRWKPKTTLGRTWYAGWSAIGTLLLVVVYPFVVLGFATRFYTRRIDGVATRIGLLGVVLLSLLVWGGLTAAAYLSRITFGGFVAVAAAGVVATASAVLAMGFARVGGRVTTVVLAYPFAVTAIFLPPVVAALYSPTVAEVVLPRSDSLAIWLLDNVLDYAGIATAVRATFELTGLAYVGMWFALAVPIGWVLGVVVTLANLVRPAPEGQRASDSAGAG